MPYRPQQGVIENGRIANADDVMNELSAIGIAIGNAEETATQEVAEALSEAKTHTNEAFAAFNVDGGTF